MYGLRSYTTGIIGLRGLVSSLLEVLHGSENVTSRTGNTPSCRATAREKCTETVGRINLELIVRVARLHCELLLEYT